MQSDNAVSLQKPQLKINPCSGWWVGGSGGWCDGVGVVVCGGGGVSRNAASIDPRCAPIITATGGQEITAALAERFYDFTYVQLTLRSLDINIKPRKNY